MKSIIKVLGLLMATTTFPQKICQEEKQNSWYHIYNTTVDIKTYYCFDEVEEKFKCGKFNAKVATTVRADYAWRYCPVSTSRSQVFCELPGQANLLKNTVVLANNTTCQYDKYHCHDTRFSKTVFWISVCNYSFQAYKGKFNVWEVAEEETTYIKNGQISLILTENIEFCGIEARRTNYDSVVASKADLNSSTYMNYSDFKKNFTKIPKRFCKPKSLTGVLSRWYIYQYPKNVAVYTCLSNSSSLCKGKVIAHITNPKILDLCIKACGYSFFQSNTKLCRETHEIDVENDVIIGLPPGCKYSEGACKPLRAFWYYTNICKNVQKVYETFEEQCGHKKCLKQNENGTKLTLQREGKLCEETVWYTDQQGLVASEMKLGFFKSKSSVFVPKERKDFSWFRPKSDIGSVKILESGKYYLIIIPLAVCVFGIVLKIAVCPVYLCINCKTPKKSVYI